MAQEEDETPQTQAQEDETESSLNKLLRHLVRSDGLNKGCWLLRTRKLSKLKTQPFVLVFFKSKSSAPTTLFLYKTFFFETVLLNYQ